MKTKKQYCFCFFLLLIHFVFGQSLPIEALSKEMNRHIYDPENFPGTWIQTNKYPNAFSGKVKSETITLNEEKVFRHFNEKGSLIKYEAYYKGKLRSDFTYEYAEDGVRLLKERGTYNIDYFHLDSNNYIGVNAFEDGKGITYGLDTMFVLQRKYSYELIRKSKLKDRSINKYDFDYNRKGSLLNVIIYENDIQVGHLLNKYNDHNQVFEQEDFWHYKQFAVADGWSEYLSNRVFKFEYDANGFIQKFTTETYSSITRTWDIQVQHLECILKQEGDQYSAKCLYSDGSYITVDIDDHGNWIRKEEFKEGKLNVSTRELNYHE